MALARIKFGDDQIVDVAEQDDYEFPHFIQRWVMPLVVITERDGKIEQVEPLGTSFAIGKGILVTAKHVLDPYFDLWADGKEPPGVGLSALFVTDEPVPGRKQVWASRMSPTNIVFNPDHDLAILTGLQARTFEGCHPQVGVAEISVDLPPPGTPVVALGYTESEGSVPGPRAIGLKQKVTAVRGQVDQLHVPQRDSVKVRWPAFEGNFPAPSGLSGAPILTPEGRVCGVVCSSIAPGDEPNPTWTSYASLTAPLFTMGLTLELAGETREWSLKELADRGIVETDGSHTKVDVVMDGGKIHYALRS